MKITIYENYTAVPESELLGYMGETNARTITIDQPDVQGADTYRLRFEYSDGVVYDVPITDNKVIITASLLREVGKINCQWLATKSNGETYEMVAKSQIFELKIGKSIGDDVAPIPTYEQSKTIADKVLEADKNITENVIRAETAARSAGQAQQATEAAVETVLKSSGTAVKAAENADQSAKTAQSAADTAMQKADELTSLLDELNSSLENRLNGGASSG